MRKVPNCFLLWTKLISLTRLHVLTSSMTAVLTRSARRSTANSLSSPPRTPSKKVRAQPGAQKTSLMASSLQLQDSVAESPSSTPSASQKKVDFSDVVPDQDPASSPPQRGCQPSKSILKNNANVYEAEPPSDPSQGSNLLADIYSNSIVVQSLSNCDSVLVAAVQALEKNSDDPDGQLEAYAALSATLRAREGDISTEALKEHANSIVGFAKRDLVSVQSVNDTLNARLVVPLLRVVDYLFFTEEVAKDIDNDLSRWFLNYALSSIESPSTPKSILGIFLHIVNFQRLSKPLSQDMAARLLAAVTKGSKFTSPTITGEYIAIYRVLLHSTPNVMLSRVRDWLPACFNYLMDQNPFVQKRALSVIQECNKSFLGNRAIGKCVIQYYEETSAMAMDSCEGSRSPSSSPSSEVPPTNIKMLSKRIEALLSSGNARFAMQLWEAVILSALCYGPNSKDTIQFWKGFEPILRISKAGLNFPNLGTKLITLSSWNVPIFVLTSVPFCQLAANDNTGTMKTSIQVLLHPFKMIDKNPYSVSVALFKNLYAMLYASLRTQPNIHLNLRQWDIIWEYVVSPVANFCMMPSVPPETVTLCTNMILHLFDTSLTSKSTASRAKILSSEIPLEEIPCIPPKWLRANAGTVFHTFLSSYFASPHTLWDEHCTRLWKSYLVGVKPIVQREVKTSFESLELVAAISNFIKSCWNRSDVGFEKCAYLIYTAIEQLGIGCFSEVSLVTNSSQFLSPGSPTKRPSSMVSTSSRGIPNSAIYHFWRMILNPHPDLLEKSSDSYNSLVQQYIRYICDRLGSNSKIAKFMSNLVAISEDKASSVWPRLAQELISQLSKRSGVVEMADTRSILISPLSNESFDGATWAKLFDTIFASSQKEEALFDIDSFTTALVKAVESVDSTTDARLLHIARALLIIKANVPSSTSGSLFKNDMSSEDIAKAIVKGLQTGQDVVVGESLLKRTTELLQSPKGSSPFAASLLGQLGRFGIPSILDSGSAATASEEYIDCLVEVYKLALDKMLGSPPTIAAMDDASPLLMSGFLSSHDKIVAATVKAWNGLVKPTSKPNDINEDLIKVVLEIEGRKIHKITLPRGTRKSSRLRAGTSPRLSTRASGGRSSPVTTPVHTPSRRTRAASQAQESPQALDKAPTPRSQRRSSRRKSSRRTPDAQEVVSKEPQADKAPKTNEIDDTQLVNNMANEESKDASGTSSKDVPESSESASVISDSPSVTEVPDSAEAGQIEKRDEPENASEETEDTQPVGERARSCTPVSKKTVALEERPSTLPRTRSGKTRQLMNGISVDGKEDSPQPEVYHFSNDVDVGGTFVPRMPWESSREVDAFASDTSDPGAETTDSKKRAREGEEEKGPTRNSPNKRAKNNNAPEENKHHCVLRQLHSLLRQVDWSNEQFDVLSSQDRVELENNLFRAFSESRMYNQRSSHE
uniref:ARAD1D33836p n=1 Tax=Blastobotrys adeninivorans TaxID=409370 RepID=A0A060TGV3_BLAAD